jgi:hypothetical protein
VGTRDVGDIENGLAIMRDGLAAWRQTGSTFRIPERLARAADTYRLADRPDEAIALIAEALTRATTDGLHPSFIGFTVSCCSALAATMKLRKRSEMLCC